MLFSKNSMAQSFTKDDLPGVWQWGTRVTDLKMTFEKDSLLIWEENERIDSMTYSLDSTVNGYILSTILRAIPLHPYMTMYRLKPLNKDQINLSSYKNMIFDSQSKSWKEAVGGDQMFVVYTMKKIN